MLAVDAKGRVALPVRHRAGLCPQPQDTLFLTKHPDGCLIVLPLSNWPDFRERVQALPAEAQGWKRVLLGFACEVQPDKAGRLLIDPVLRRHADLAQPGQALLIGLGSHCELWSPERYDSREAALLAQPLPEALRSLRY